MKNFKHFYLLLSVLVISGCSSDDEAMVDPAPQPTGNVMTYELSSVAVPEISGVATFIENDDNSVTVELDLENTPSGGEHPAHIHFNSAAEGGDIAISLAPVDGSTGFSTITFSAEDDGTPITYDQVLEYDGYINVHLSADDLGTIVAQGDIGQNELTGESKVYTLGSKDVDGISGTATFEERVNGEALATIDLENTPDGGEHPAHIHMNTAAETGNIVFSFNPVDGTTGMSRTNLDAFDDGTAFNYEDVLEYDGYINVHLSADDLGTIVAQGDIGQNELTGESTVYALDSRAVPGISGEALFEERQNETTLVTLNLTGTPAGGEHPAHIHENDAATGGGIVISLNSVNGTTGMSQTQVEALDDGAAITYSELLNFDGHVNVHLSPADLATIVAQGNIGANE